MWLSGDPIAEDGGENLYGLSYNAPPNSIDAFGLKSCCCCCAEDLTIELVPHTGVVGSKYGITFRPKATLGYEASTQPVTDGQCKLKWTETYWGDPPWYDDPRMREGTPVDVTTLTPFEDMGWKSPPSFPWLCRGTKTVEGSYDTAGGPLSHDWETRYKVEISVESSVDKGCAYLCKSPKKTATVTMRLRVKNGKPDRKFEHFTWVVN
jgi:hypothetical protein